MIDKRSVVDSLFQPDGLSMLLRCLAVSSSLSCLDLVFGLDFDLVFFDLDRYSSSYSASSSSLDFFLGRAGLSLLRDFGVPSVGSLAVPHEAQNFAVDLSLCPQLSQNAIFSKSVFD